MSRTQVLLTKIAKLCSEICDIKTEDKSGKYSSKLPESRRKPQKNHSSAVSGTASIPGSYTRVKITKPPALLALTLMYGGCTTSISGSYIRTKITKPPTLLAPTPVCGGCTASTPGSHTRIKITKPPALLALTLMLGGLRVM